MTGEVTQLHLPDPSNEIGMRADAVLEKGDLDGWGSGYWRYFASDKIDPLLQPTVAFSLVCMPPVSDFFNIGGGNHWLF